MKIVALAACLCILTSLACAQSSPPPEWRFPAESDGTDGWKDFRGHGAAPFHARADFNGDGVDDDAWILLSTRNESWGLFVFENLKTGPARVVELEVTDPEKGQGRKPQSMGVGVAPAGNHKTACGKGYWRCREGEPEVLRLTLPGIDYFRFESASSIFWWDTKAKTFRRTWISD